MQEFIIAKSNTFSRNERLKSRKLIGHLFSDGKSFSSYPLKVLYTVADEGANTLQAGVTVSSRHFKKAVQRNRIKRLTREAYRLHNKPLKDLLSQGKTITLFFIYTGKQLPTLPEVSASMESLLQRLVNVFSKPA